MTRRFGLPSLLGAGIAIGLVGLWATGGATASTPTTTLPLGAVPTVPPPTLPPVPTTTVAGPTTVAPLTLPPTTTLPPPTTLPPLTLPPTSTAPATTAPPPLPGAAPANASMEQLEQAAAAMFGPTEDLAGELTPWVPVPAGIPTPPGAELIDFSFSIDATAEEGSYYASIDFTSTESPADLVTFFESSMLANGYTKTSDGAQTEQGSSQRDMSFEGPDPALGYGGISVQVLDSDIDYGRLSWSYDTTVASLAPFTGWFADLPIPPNGVIYSAGLNSFTGFGSRTVSVSTSFEYLGVAQPDNMAAMLGAFPTSDFSLDPDDDPDDEFFYISSPRYPDGISVYLYDWDFPEGSSRLNIDTSFELPLS